MVATEYEQWYLYFYKRPDNRLGDGLLSSTQRSLLPTIRSSLVDGQPFILNQSGDPHEAVNAFFAGARMRARADSTNLRYARSLRNFLNFLALGRFNWNDATDETLWDYKYWRRTDGSNPNPIAGNSWDTDLAAIASFYEWSRRAWTSELSLGLVAKELHGRRPARRPEGANARRQADTKWLTPGAYQTWRKIGLLGFDAGGRELARWRPRNDARDSAFADGLYGTGLRTQEWASVLMSEIPVPRDTAEFSTARSADACSKNLRGHKYWIPRAAMNSLLNYVEGDRKSSVSTAQTAGAYDRLTNVLVVRELGAGGSICLENSAGQITRTNVNELPPSRRAALFERTESGLSPMWLWLNQDGSPRPKHSWQKTFRAANDRVKRAGVGNLSCRPHMLRHSFALRWYAVGRIIWEGRSDKVTDKSARDFQYQFGDTWSIVQTMLGHANVQTTRDIYLEPFLSLDIEILMNHGQDVVSDEALHRLFAADPRVVTQSNLEWSQR